MKMKKGIANYHYGEVFNGYMLVKNSTQGTARNGKEYLNVTLSDSSGEITAMVWDADENKIKIFTTGHIVNVEGKIDEYQGKKQINLQNFRLKNEDDGVILSDLLKSAPMEGELLFKLILSTVLGMKNEKIKMITSALLEEYEEDFKAYPAAKSMHHNYVSGLAYHTFCMLEIAKSLCEIYPELNKDLLYAGVILHDLQKVREYDGVVSTERTLEGMLKGHLVMISEEIGSVAKELGIEGEEVLLLQTLTLSHHLKGEWGSPVAPQILEAEILHYIDMIDARMDMLKNALSKVEKGEFTEKLWGLDNRSFYKPNIN